MSKKCKHNWLIEISHMKRSVTEDLPDLLDPLAKEVIMVTIVMTMTKSRLVVSLKITGVR